MHEKIYTLAAAIAGPTEEERPLLEALCTAAQADLASRLREGTAPEECGEAFFCAAALMATAGLLPGREAGGVEQFTVGEVSVRTGGRDGCTAAAALRRQAAALIAPYCEDDSFAFWGVRG